MRFLLITNIFPPHIGGPATFIDRVAHALAKAGHRVTVVCSSDRPSDEADRRRPFRVRRVCLVRREWYEIKVRALLFLEMLRHRHILVNGLESYVAQINGVLRKRYVLKIVGDSAWETARNRGTTLAGIDAFQQDVGEQRKHRALVDARNRCLQFAAEIFTPSDYLRRMVTGWGVPPGRVHTIRNGVEVEPTKSERVEPRAGALKVLFVGRLTNWKGVETLLLALVNLPNVSATIIGDGPEYPHLVDLGRQLGLEDKVRFEGSLPPDVVRQRMIDADALVLVSLYEGLSHTLLEACSVGCPCIASDIGGNREVIVDNDNGLLVPPQNVATLRRALERLRDDAGLRRRLGQQAQSTARGHALTGTVDEVVQLLTRA